MLPPPVFTFQQGNALSDRVGSGGRPFCLLQQEVMAKSPVEIPEVAIELQDGDKEKKSSDTWPASATNL